MHGHRTGLYRPQPSSFHSPAGSQNAETGPLLPQAWGGGPNIVGPISMVKFGITAFGPRATAALAQEDAHRGWWPFAYTLLPELAKISVTDADEALIERLYRSMRAGTGTYKITRRSRSAVMDEVLVNLLAERFPATSPIRIHDMAASNAVTSLEMFDCLRQKLDVYVHASDYYDALYIVSLADSAWQVVLDVNLRPLQFVGYGMVLSGYKWEPARYPINRLAQTIVRRRVVSRATELAARVLREGMETNGSGEVRRVSLFHPRCIEDARASTRFSLGRDDVFEPAPASYQVIRVTNALTTDHFSLDRVRDAIVAVCRNLERGGLLLLGRNADETDGALRATVFVRNGETLVGIRDLAGGYELKDEVEALRLDDRRPMRNAMANR